jgi:hypothetical protein
MNRLRKLGMLGWWLAGAGLTAALLLCAWTFSRTTEDASVALPDLERWDVPRLSEYLCSQGLHFRLVPTNEGGTPIADNAYLTTTDKSRLELDDQLKVRECIDAWKGTVYCERVYQPGRRDLQIIVWGDCCLVAGPFIFFGDRDLLDQIGKALHLP